MRKKQVQQTDEDSNEVKSSRALVIRRIQRLVFGQIQHFADAQVHGRVCSLESLHSVLGKSPLAGA